MIATTVIVHLLLVLVSVPCALLIGWSIQTMIDDVGSKRWSSKI